MKEARTAGYHQGGRLLCRVGYILISIILAIVMKGIRTEHGFGVEVGAGLALSVEDLKVVQRRLSPRQLGARARST